MPESGAKSHVNNGKAVQSVNPHQSAWLSHWTGTRSETIEHDHLAQLSKIKENDLNDIDFKRHLMSSDNFGCSKDVDLTMSLKKPSSQSFQFFKHGQESGKCSLFNEQVQALGLGPLVSHKKLTSCLSIEASSRENHLQPTDHVKYHMFFSESSYSSSRPYDHGVYKLDSQTTHGPENFLHLTASFASKEHLLKSEKLKMPSFSRQSNTPLLKADTSTSSYRSLSFIKERYKRMKQHMGMGILPLHAGSPRHSKSKTVHHCQSSFQNVPHVVHDVAMTKMSGGLHNFSRTTHSLLLRKQTDINVYQESQFCRESQLSIQNKGEVLRELSCSPPCFGQGQQGVNLQLLGSSDHESQENVEVYRASGSLDVQKNELAADSNAMDVESFKENHLSGVHVFPTNKDITGELTVEKDKCRKRKIERSDINLEISAQPEASSSPEKAEPSMSGTQSLDINKLHYNLDQTTNSNSYECSNTNPGLESGSRWIKRLKLAETPSHGKMNRFFTRVMEGKPEPASDKHYGKKSEIQIGESSSVETKRECKEISLSHSWIQRWSHKQSPKNPKTVETCKLDNPEVETNEYQQKQFPSIAAMALMGKAMTGSPVCMLQKKDSFVVWDTKLLVSNTGGISNAVLF